MSVKKADRAGDSGAGFYLTFLAAMYVYKLMSCCYLMQTSHISGVFFKAMQYKGLFSKRQEYSIAMIKNR